MKLIIKSSLLFLTFLIIFSCTKKESEITENNIVLNEINVEKLLSVKLGILKLKNESINLSLFNINQKNYDLSNHVLYTTEFSNEKILIIPEIANSNNYALFKFTDDNGKYTIDKELVMYFGLDCEGNGIIEINNITDNAYFTSTYINGISVDGDDLNSLNELDPIAKGFCQRLANETFRNCFKRLEDHICDDMLGTFAWYTNPQIALLVAAMCNCTAS